MSGTLDNQCPGYPAYDITKNALSVVVPVPAACRSPLQFGSAAPGAAVHRPSSSFSCSIFHEMLSTLPCSHFPEHRTWW